jgi:ubiquinone/menaquinone biosynthesis C-methylase UbiE
METSDYSANLARFTGFADTYDRYRPAPPEMLLEFVPRLARVDRPRLVVDLGSGTGLSTRFWVNHADNVVGVEPTADMRAAAAQITSSTSISYIEGYSHATNLPSACADVVTCSQALHWMEPEGTFQEVARVLRPGGVFAAYDCDWPPLSSSWEADAAFLELMERVSSLERQHASNEGLRFWSKHEHLSRMRASGRFRFSREILIHQSDLGNAERLVGLAHSQGSVAMLLKMGVSETDIGLDQFARRVERVLGSTPGPWLWSYRVRLGIL